MGSPGLTSGLGLLELQDFPTVEDMNEGLDPEMVLALGAPEAEWAMGQIADSDEGRKTIHPAPAFAVGHISSKSGVRAVVACGRGFQRAVGRNDVTRWRPPKQCAGSPSGFRNCPDHLSVRPVSGANSSSTSPRHASASRNPPESGLSAWPRVGLPQGQPPPAD